MSLRSTDGETDVSAIARTYGGGGHPRAAGFSTDLSYEEIVEALCAELEQTADPGPGVLLIDKPAGVTSHDVVARVRRERGRQDRARRAPSTRSPPAS